MAFRPKEHPRAVSCGSCNQITLWFANQNEQSCHLCGEQLELCKCLYCSGTNYVCIHSPVAVAYCFDCGYGGDGGDLEGFEFDGTDLSYLIFRKATLASIFSRCNFSKSVFSGATITNEFFRCNFSGTDLSGVLANGGDVFDLSASFAYCDFTDANLSDGNFSDCYFQGSTFFRANLTNACFDYADLSGVDLRDAILDGATFEHAILEDTIFPSEFSKNLVSPVIEPQEKHDNGSANGMREDYMRDGLS